MTDQVNTGRIPEALERIGTAGGFPKADAPAIVAALALLSHAAAAEALDRLIAATAQTAREPTAHLLARAAAVLGPVHTAPAATRLVALLPERPDERKPGPGFVADLMTALCGLDPTLAERAADTILARPAVFDADDALVPGALTLRSSDIAGPGVERLRQGARAHLAARIALPLEPPRDWRREARLPCSCEDCRELSTFLADPERENWSLRAAQHRRSHVETTILNAKPDLTCTTERKGSPHRLICTKTQASYERRVEQRRQDLANLGRIDGGGM